MIGLVPDRDWSGARVRDRAGSTTRRHRDCDWPQNWPGTGSRSKGPGRTYGDSESGPGRHGSRANKVTLERKVTTITVTRVIGITVTGGPSRSSANWGAIISD
jgi:hypothetical protein